MRNPDASPGASIRRTGRLFLVAAILALLIPTAALPSELRGRIQDARSGAAPRDGKLTLRCPSDGFEKPIDLADDGSFRLRGVPEGSCNLQVDSNRGTVTATVLIKGAIVRFNAELRQISGRLVLIKK